MQKCKKKKYLKVKSVETWHQFLNKRLHVLNKEPKLLATCRWMHVPAMCTKRNRLKRRYRIAALIINIVSVFRGIFMF